MAASIWLCADQCRAQETTVAEVQALYEEAKTKRAELLSPRAFKAAQGVWEKDRLEAQGGQGTALTPKLLYKVGQDFQTAMRNADLVSFTFPNLIKARDDAEQQRAPEIAPESFKKGDRAFGDIIALMEQGDLAKSREKAPAAERELRNAELDAIKAGILGEARQLQDRAETIGAANRAPLAFQKAQGALKVTEDFIAANRYEEESAEEMADSVEYQYRRAIHISQWVTSLKKEDNWERLILQFEGELDDIGRTLQLHLEFDRNYDVSAEEIMATIRSLLEDRRHLQEELSKRDAQIGQLEAESGKLKAETGRYVVELESKKEELEKRKRLEAKISKIRDLFKPEEALVLQLSGQIVLRVTGLRFPSGASKVKSENFDLLNKVQQALREFPDRHIEVQGHTDSQGDDQANLELSQKRAEAIKTYLRQNMNLSEEDLTAVGLGESQPISSNDSASGRAANRRIEIVLSP